MRAALKGVANLMGTAHVTLQNQPEPTCIALVGRMLCSSAQETIGASDKEHEADEDAPAMALLSEHITDYSEAYSRLRTEAGLGPVDAAAHTAHMGLPDGTACRDYHRQCSEWAGKVSNQDARATAGAMPFLAAAPWCSGPRRLRSTDILHCCAQGECEANPRYMLGDEDQSALKGYCRLACGTCTPDAPAGCLKCM